MATFAVPVVKNGLHTSFKLRSQSQRRYVVVSTVTESVVRRSDNLATARKVRTEQPLSRVILDTATGGLVF